MWWWIPILMVALVVGFLLGVLTTRHSLDAGAALQQNAAQLLNLHRMERTMLQLWRFLQREQQHQKAWMEKLDRMDISQAATIKALYRIGGIGLAPGDTQHAKVTVGDRPGRSDGPTVKKSDSDALGGHI